MEILLKYSMEDPYNHYLENENGDKFHFDSHSKNGEELSSFLAGAEVLVETNFEPEHARYFNVYKDEDGKFLGDNHYPTYDEAFQNRDGLGTYLDTVKIVSEHGF